MIPLPKVVSNDIIVTRIAAAKRSDDEGFLQHYFFNLPTTWQHYIGVWKAIFGGMHCIIIPFVICQLKNMIGKPDGLAFLDGLYY